MRQCSIAAPCQCSPASGPAGVRPRVGLSPKIPHADAGMRIDHFLLSPQVDKRLLAAGVDSYVRGWEKSSDHAPVWIELKD